MRSWENLLRDGRCWRCSLVPYQVSELVHGSACRAVWQWWELYSIDCYLVGYMSAGRCVCFPRSFTLYTHVYLHMCVCFCLCRIRGSDLCALQTEEVLHLNGTVLMDPWKQHPLHEGHAPQSQHHSTGIRLICAVDTGRDVPRHTEE